MESTPTKPQKSRKQSKFSKFFDPKFYRANLSLCFFTLVYVLIQIGIIVDRVFRYIDKNPAIIVARSAGILLSFNMSLIVLLILKRCLTWVGNIKVLRKILPINDFVTIHKCIGVYILVLSFIHTIAHCVNQCKIFKRSLKN